MTAVKISRRVRIERDAPGLFGARCLPVIACWLMGLGARAIRIASLGFALCFLLAQGAGAQYAGPTVPPSDEALFSLDSPVGPIDYLAGRGLRLGRTGLTIGGFATLEIDKERQEDATLEIDGLNFLILWEPLDFARAFAELEIGDLLSYNITTGESLSDAKLQVERLYGDLTRNDALNLRVGKFQTPVGIWNLVPAEPFTWTATEPVLVETAFDEHTTGGALFGSLFPGSERVDYWLYGQFVDPFQPSEDPLPADRSVGGRLRYAGLLDRWSVGTSFLASERQGRWSYLGGLDAFFQAGPFELQGEFVISRGDIEDRDLWSVYAQGVYHLGQNVPFLRGLHLVGRYEHFVPREDRTANVYNIGLTWTPVHFIIFKAGYQFTEGQSDVVNPGFFSSFSILF